MEVQTIKCPNCGGQLEYAGNVKACVCPFCDAIVKLDDGVKRSEHTVNYRDEARLKELELQEEERLRNEQEKRAAEERKRDEQRRQAKKKRNAFLLKLFLGLVVILFLVKSCNDANDPSKPRPTPTPTPLVDEYWYNKSAIVVQEKSFKAKKEREVKGPLSYEIPKSWEIGDTTVDSFKSIYYVKKWGKDVQLETDVYLQHMDVNSNTWDTNTWNQKADQFIRDIVTSPIKSIKPMMICGRKGAHAEAGNSVSTIHIFQVIVEDYICTVLYYGKDYEMDDHIDEVYYMLQTMEWDFPDTIPADNGETASSGDVWYEKELRSLKKYDFSGETVTQQKGVFQFEVPASWRAVDTSGSDDGTYYYPFEDTNKTYLSASTTTLEIEGLDFDQLKGKEVYFLLDKYIDGIRKSEGVITLEASPVTFNERYIALVEMSLKLDDSDDPIGGRMILVPAKNQIIVLSEMLGNGDKNIQIEDYLAVVNSLQVVDSN